MKADLVVTITCPDRPGVVERISAVIVGFSANWEESRMARLGGDFAGIVKISVSREKAEALADALRALADEEMTVVVKFTPPTASDLLEGYLLRHLRVVGADHDGILHAVCRHLADQGINIESLETDLLRAPVSGSTLFQMEAQIKVPRRLPLAELNANLARIGEDLGVDIDICSCQR